MEEVQKLYELQVLSYNANVSPEIKRDVDNLNRGRIDILRILLGIGDELQEIKEKEIKEATEPKVSNPGAY